MDFLISGVLAITWKQAVMYVIGLLLIWLAVKKEYEPSLLLPMGFGAVLVNLPFSGVLNQNLQGVGETNGIIEWLFHIGIEASEALPILLFIGIGAMIDFGPLLSKPALFLFGAAAQFGIFAAMLLAACLGFALKDAAAIGIIGAADGPTLFWFPRFCIPIISEPLRLPPTPIWRWCPLSSPLPLKWSPRKRNAAL